MVSFLRRARLAVESRLSRLELACASFDLLSALRGLRVKLSSADRACAPHRSSTVLAQVGLRRALGLGTVQRREPHAKTTKGGKKDDPRPGTARHGRRIRSRGRRPALASWPQGSLRLREIHAKARRAQATRNAREPADRWRGPGDQCAGRSEPQFALITPAPFAPLREVSSGWRPKAARGLGLNSPLPDCASTRFSRLRLLRPRRGGRCARRRAAGISRAERSPDLLERRANRIAQQGSGGWTVRDGTRFAIDTVPRSPMEAFETRPPPSCPCRPS